MKLFLSILGCFVAGAGLRAAEVSNIPREDYWVPNGPVHAALVTNGMLYLAGEFEYIGPTTGTGAALDLFSGVAVPTFPRTDGAIFAAVSDGEGGWFVGGQFNRLGEFAVINLGHIRADRTVDANWAPNPDGVVKVLLAAPGRLYVGGTFEHLGGQSRALLAALEPSSGAVLPWTVNVSNSLANASVNALALDDERLYIGGAFSFINSAERVMLGAVDVVTGEVLPWNPNGFNTQGVNRIDAIAIRNRTVYVGGTFTSITQPPAVLVARNYLAAFDEDTAALLPWNPNADGPVAALVPSCETLYVAGSFRRISGVPRNYLAAVELVAGVLQEWNPNPNGPVRALVLSGHTIYLGGMFSQVGGLHHDYVAAVDLASGRPHPWAPRGDFDVSALAVAGDSVFVGGRFSAGGQVRRNVAALEVRTGQLAEWNPDVNGPVRELAATPSTVYLAGDFTEVRGQPRKGLGAVDAILGQPTGWDPKPSGPVRALALAGATLYVGGSITMTNIAGEKRSRVAAFSLPTGGLSAWAPEANDEVDAILPDGGTVYLGGRFTRMAGQARRRLAAVDAGNGSVQSWDPSASDQVNRLALVGETLVAAGYFNFVGGLARTGVVALAKATGQPTDWNPNPHFDQIIGGILRPSSMNAVAFDDERIYLGGFFNHVGREPRAYAAAVEGPSFALRATAGGPSLGHGQRAPGAVLAWQPQFDAHINALALSPELVFAGGAFQTVAGHYRPHLAAFPTEGAPRIVQQPLNLIITNGETARFYLTADGEAPLVYQWKFNGADIPGEDRPTLILPTAGVGDAGDYAVVVTNARGLVNSRAAVLTVVEPLQILVQPQSQTVAPGVTVTLSVTTSGSPAPVFQWRLNGVNIPGAIYPTLTLPNAQPSDGGSYQVVVANLAGAVSSEVASLLVGSPNLPFADQLSSRGRISTPAGVGRGSNVGASCEPGEPHHVGVRGGRSVWLGWVAPATGLASFRTRGSSFDTLLAVYSDPPSNLTLVAADEDRGGFYTSQTAFNAVAGTEYLIAIDGFSGASGEIVLSWSLDTRTVDFPRIINEPLSVSVVAGQSAMFSVNATNGMSGSRLTYQWYFGCLPVVGATNTSLILGNVQLAQVGAYRVEVRSASGQVASSTEAALEIGPDPRVLSRDKVEEFDLLSCLEPSAGGNPWRAADLSSPGWISVSVGSVGAQLFDNAGSGSNPNETNHCGTLGGVSRFFDLRALDSATIVVDTIGSRIDTVVAVYYRTNVLNLAANYIACDNNGAPDGIRSLVRFPSTAGRDYRVFVDGVGGAQGEIDLHWKMGHPPRFVTNAAARITLASGQALALEARVNVETNESWTGIVSYQWLHNGNLLAAATNKMLSVERVDTRQGGTYSLSAGNDFGRATGVVAVVTVVNLRLGIERKAAGDIRVQLEAPRGATVRLENSTDFIDWAAWLTNVATGVPVYFDLPTSNNKHGFIRAQLQQ